MLFPKRYFPPNYYPVTYYGAGSLFDNPLRIVADGGMGIGVNPDGADFPFAYTIEPPLLGLLADMKLHLTGTTRNGPYRVTWMYGFNRLFYEPPLDAMVTVSPYVAAHPADIVIADNDDIVVFNSTLGDCVYTGREFSPRLYVHKWQSSQGILYVVQHTAVSNSDDAPVDYTVAPGLAGTLDSRVVSVTPRSITRLRVDDTTIATKSVTLLAGFNTSIVGVANRLTIDAVDGAGFGIADCQDRPPGIYTINGIAPNKYGDIVIAGDPCVTVGAAETLDPIWTPIPSNISVRSDCEPCGRKCSDYANTYAALGRADVILRATGETYDSTYDLHTANIGRWEEQRQCRIEKSLTVSVLPIGRYVAITAAMCNSLPSCMEDLRIFLKVRVDWQVGDSCDRYLMTPVPNSTFIFNKSWTAYKFKTDAEFPYKLIAEWKSLERHRTAIVKTVFEVPCIGPSTRVVACVNARSLHGGHYPLPTAHSVRCQSARIKPE